MELQKVSIVIANLNGKHHLRECLESIRKLHYPKDKIEVVMIDNGSTDGSVEFIRQNYAWVKLLCNSKNEGFAKPSNDGARAASGKYVAFLNNDMRVQSDWLSELIESMENTGAKCAGSVILNWDGKFLDFAGGGVNFCGLGYQDDYRRPMKEMEPLLKQDKQLLFACGGAMIVDREMFLSSGGFDEDYFAYYEDADLGWRLNVLGCKVVLSVKSRVYHKHNSTSKTIAKERIQYLFERNKLYTCYKNYGEELLNKIFFPSVLLQIRDLYMDSGIDGYNYDIKNPGAFDDDPVNISQRTAMKVSALNEFTANITKMTEKRSFIQKNRKKPDSEIAKLIGKPFMSFLHYTGEYVNAEYDIVKAFKIDESLNKQLKTNLLIIADDGSQNRCLNFIKLLKADKNLEITAAYRGGCEPDYKPSVTYSENDSSALSEAIRKSVIIILMTDKPLENPDIKRAIAEKYVAVDLYFASEQFGNKEKLAALLYDIAGITDFFICSDESQRISLFSVLNELKAIDKQDTENLADEIVSVIKTEHDSSAKALISFCFSPRHSLLRGFHENDDDECVFCGNMDFANEDLQTNHSLSRQLLRIENRQAEIQKMLLSDRRTLKNMQTGIKEFKNWSLLMERRFFKIKGKLKNIKFLKRFIGD
ncbi:MAG TPA: glycosyltransferase family 2 protein [Ruminiclostridium sp.]|nr:glycosyltransferase family 2 protein [Ruminiclostridium sp.]